MNDCVSELGLTWSFLRGVSSNASRVSLLSCLWQTFLVSSVSACNRTTSSRCMSLDEREAYGRNAGNRKHLGREAQASRARQGHVWSRSSGLTQNSLHSLLAERLSGETTTDCLVVAQRHSSLGGSSITYRPQKSTG